ncbi:MAG: riboflavin synthase [Legionella sp.]|nr:riboflavin synthase [Legionella sp.]
MFTGLVTSCGTLLSQTNTESGMRLVFEADFKDLILGESIAINGVCLTLILDNEAKCLIFDVSPETQQCTNLGKLMLGDKVHLERALRLSDRLGGHYVTGHVDTTARLASITPVDDCLEMVIDGFTSEQMRYLCLKGSVALDGVSLTINAFDHSKNNIAVMLIPHTLSKTILSTWVIGQCINIEFDYLARVLVHQLQLGSLPDSTILPLFERSLTSKEVSV